MAKKRVQLSNRPGSASGHNPGAAHKSYGKPAVPSKARRITLGGLPHRLTVVCVWWGNKFGIEYVERLKNMVARNMPGAVRYDFICITPFSDEIDGVFRIHQRQRLRGGGRRLDCSIQTSSDPVSGYSTLIWTSSFVGRWKKSFELRIRSVCLTTSAPIADIALTIHP